MYVFDYLRFSFKTQDFSVIYGVTGTKILEKREVRSHNKVRALFAKNKVRFAREEQLFCQALDLV